MLQSRQDLPSFIPRVPSLKSMSINVKDVAKKDFYSSLGLWLGLEFICFVVCPALQIIRPGERLQSWFALSLPLGIMGALTIGASTQLVAASTDAVTRENKFLRMWVGQFGGWLGLVGIAFPLLMIGIEFLAEAVRKIVEIQKVG